MPTARKTSTATPRKRRTRKAPAKVQPTIKEVKKVTVETPVRPTTLLKSSDYINDIKWSYNQVRDYVVSVYNREFATK